MPPDETAHAAQHGRASLVLLVFAAAALLVGIGRWLPRQTPPSALAIDIPNAVSAEDQSALPHVSREVRLDQPIRVAARAAGDDRASDPIAVPLEWTFQFSIDRSRLRPSTERHASLLRQESSYHVTIFLASGKSIEFGRNELPASSPVQVSFKHSNFGPLLRGASFVVATCPQGVGETADVFFSGEHGRSGTLVSNALSMDLEARIIDFGQQVLEPVPYLGKVMMHAREGQQVFSAFISSKPLEHRLIGQFGRRIPGRLKSFSSAGGEVEAYSFGPGEKWSVLLQSAKGDFVSSHEVLRGADIEIGYERPQGVSVSVDLQRFPDASRLLFVPATDPLDEALTKGAFEARVQGALSTNAIPIPRFRRAGAPFTTGVTSVEDGSVRIELWSRRSTGIPADWQLLHSRSVTVAGDVVELSF